MGLAAAIGITTLSFLALAISPAFGDTTGAEPVPAVVID
jgi:hypothetical protein